MKIKHFLTQLKDIIITDLIHILPSIIKWFYFLKIKKEICVFKIKNLYGKKAKLYQHGEFKSEKQDAPAILLLHGLYSHPLVMLHLAQLAQKTKIGSVFSLSLSYNEANFDCHRTLIEQAIDKIEQLLCHKESSLKGVIMVGHSMGAIEAAFRAFVVQDKRILSVISIAGRLKVVESTNYPCRESLKSTVHQIYKGVQLLPMFPLFQIVGRYDWNASLKATLIRNDKNFSHIVEDAMHFNILFHKDIREKLPEFLKKSSLYNP